MILQKPSSTFISQSPENMNILLNIHGKQSTFKGQRGPVFSLPSTRVQHKLPGAVTIGCAIQWIKTMLSWVLILSPTFPPRARFSTRDSPEQKHPTANGAIT